jgi:hypothetical protein
VAELAIMETHKGVFALGKSVRHGMHDLFYIVIDTSTMSRSSNLLVLEPVSGVVTILLIVHLIKVRFDFYAVWPGNLGLDLDVKGCPTVVPGNYFNCG